MKIRYRLGFGFTLLELLIAIVILGVALAVVAPSIKGYLESQRLRSVSSEMLNDFQFARGEAVARKQPVGIRFDSDGTRTCYTVGAYTGANCLASAPGDAVSTCSCLSGAGTACAAGAWTEIKTVNVPRSLGVRVQNVHPIYKAVAFDPTSGNVLNCYSNLVGGVPPTFAVNTTALSAGQLQTQVAPTGRPRTCMTPGVVVPGVPAC